MTLLVVQIAPRPRARAGHAAGAERSAAEPVELAFVTSEDGVAVTGQGQCAPALLPKATTSVAVLADTDVSWHRIVLPKAPAARLRAALAGVLEEALLEEADGVHLALAPSPVAGQPTWVAAVDRGWLKRELGRLEQAGVSIDRVVPASWPDDPPSGHFADAPADGAAAAEGLMLHWSHADGVASLRLQGELVRAVLPAAAQTTRWSASPAAAAAAEQWLGRPVTVLGAGERALQAARSLWNLRQFELAATRRGTRALRDAARQFLAPAWKPVRVGLVALLAVQVIGLNLWALAQRQAIADKRIAVSQLVKASFPRVSEIDLQRDPAAVMQREARFLRMQAGRAGDDDLEPMLEAAAAAWPADRPPVAQLRFEPGRLTLSAAGWSDAQIGQFRSLLQPAGFTVETADGQLSLRSGRAGRAL